MNVVSAAQRARDHTSVVRPKHLLSIRKTGTKHWPQTLFQDLGGVDSLQLYHSTGRFTARIRTDTIRRLAPMDSAVEKALTKVATTEAGSLSDIEASIAAAQAGDRDAARQILSGGPMTNALLNHLREQMGKRASALGIGVADRLATANVVEPTRLLTKSCEARPAQQQKKEMTCER